MGLALLTIGLAGCGQGFHAVGAIGPVGKSSSSMSSASNPDSNSHSNSNSTLSTEGNVMSSTDWSAVEQTFSGAFAELLTHLEDLNAVSFSANAQTLSENLSVPCNQGSISLTGQANLGFSLSYPQTSASLSNGSGNIVFNSCALQASDGATLVLNGELNTSLSEVALNLTLDLLDASGNYSGNGSAQAGGQLQISLNGVPFSCDVSAIGTSSLTGSFQGLTSLSTSGQTANQVNGQICGQSFTQQVSFNF